MKYLSSLLTAVFALSLIFALSCGNNGKDQKCDDKDSLQSDSLTDDKAASATADNTLSKAEKAEGWELLFDGTSTDQWRGAYLSHFPEKGWIVEDGKLIVLASGGAESQNGGDIVTKKQYSDFELKVDFKLTQGANSGIKYYVTLAEEGNEGSAFGLEYQLLDDAKHPDAKKGRDGNRTLGSLYDMMAAPANKPANPIGQWNTAHIVSKDNKVEYFLNGEKLIEFQRGSPEFRDLVAKSKYADPKYNTQAPFGEAEKGHILLQDHGNKVSFKNIKIKDLSK